VRFLLSPVPFLLAVALSGTAEAQNAQNKRFDLKESHDILFANAPVKPSGTSKPLYLDLYEPQAETPALRPAVIAVHGGGFRGGDKRSARMVEFCRYLSERGYVCASIDYRVEEDQPDTYGPTPRHQVIIGSMEDTSAALEWMHINAERFRIDTKRIALAGSSAGATSVLLAGFANPAELPQVQVIIDMWGGLGGPVSIISKGKPAVIIVHSKGDESVPYSEALKISHQAEAEGVPFRLISIEGSDHGVDLNKPHQGKPIWDHITEFLAIHMK